MVPVGKLGSGLGRVRQLGGGKRKMIWGAGVKVQRRLQTRPRPAFYLLSTGLYSIGLFCPVL